MRENRGSIEILKSILNGMDAYLYVSDPDTDEILFINDNMREHFGLKDGQGIGETCWKVLREGATRRCEFCPNRTLLKNPDKEIVQEERDIVAGRYYKITDKLIEWIGGKPVHLRYAEDITDLKITEQTLKEQVERMKVISEISQSFISSITTKQTIQSALREVGEFLGVNHVFISEKKKGYLKCAQEWCDKSATPFLGNAGGWPLTQDMPYYKQLMRDGYATVSNYAELDHENFKVLENHGITAFLNVAIDVGSDLWGVVGFINYGEPREWTPGDVEFGRIIGRILSGVLNKMIAEDALLNAQKMLSAVIEHVPMPVFWKDTELKYQGYNNRFAGFFEKNESLINKNDYEVMIRYDAEISEAQDKKLLLDGEPIVVESQVTNANGELRWVHLKKSIVKDNDEQPVLIVGVADDITERVEAEKDIMRMSAIVNRSPQYIAYMDSEGRFNFFNPGTCEVTGYSYDELAEGGIKILYDSETYSKIINELVPKIMDEGRLEFELPLRRKDGEIRDMLFSAFLLDLKDYGIGTIAQDVTDRKKIELELVEAKEMAEQGSKAKGEFLSRMSHEMRTPMNAIIGMTSIAQSAKDIEKKDYCLNKIYDASKHLLGVINDILDMSKIEANKFELSSEEFDLEKMLINVTDVINYSAEEKKQNLLVQLSSSIPTIIISDELRLSQVITNLLSNAVKFTHEGGTIRLSVEKVKETDDICELLFVVADNGIGLTAEQQARLFRSFEQANGGIARKYGGTGLGLVISKQIVELLGGRIWVESEEGHGSKFSFTAAVTKSKNQPHEGLANMIKRSDVRILAVDDAPETREYFKHAMGELNLPCDVAADGIEALEMIEKCRDNPYNVFFIDWQMPGMDGIELTRHIKNQSDNNSVVIMISVTEWSDIEQQAVAAGVNHFVPKPLFLSVLVDIINRYVSVSEKGHSKMKYSASRRSVNFSGVKVLLAEDIAVNREIIQAFLGETNVKVDFAENGIEAVNLFRQSPDKYSLILMDVHMPEMDGFEATRAIRALDLPQAKKIPIVAMTANVFKEDIDRCILSGMNDHIGKPIDKEGLITKMSKYVVETPGNGTSEKIVPETIELDWATLMPYVDVEDGLQRLMSNKKLYISLLGKFAGRKMADDLIQAINENDGSRVVQAAHAIKGAAANLGLNELREVCAEIEKHAKASVSCNDIIERLDNVATATENAIAAFLRSEGC